MVQRSTGPARPCRAADLDAHFRPEGEGATGHYANLLDLRNVSRARCVLSGYPVGVSLSEPGHRTVRTARGAFFDPLPPRPMYPGGVTTLVIESDTYCGARPSGGPPGPIYRHATVRLNHGVVRATTRGARGIDVGCGAFVSQFGRWLGAS